MATNETTQNPRTASASDYGTKGNEPSLSTNATAAIASFSKTARELAVLPAK